jgi:hypothetical protein
MKNSIKYIVAGLFALVFAGQIFASVSTQPIAKGGCMPDDPQIPEETF